MLYKQADFKRLSVHGASKRKIGEPFFLAFRKGTVIHHIDGEEIIYINNDGEKLTDMRRFVFLEHSSHYGGNGALKSIGTIPVLDDIDNPILFEIISVENQ